MSGPHQILRTSEVMAFRKESITVTILDQKNSELHSQSGPYTRREVYIPPLIKEASFPRK